MRLAAPAVVDEVGLEADDRLDAVLLGRLVELDRAVHHAVVGEPEGGLAEARGALGELVDLARAVEQRVLGVDVEMGAAGGVTDFSGYEIHRTTPGPGSAGHAASTGTSRGRWSGP